MDNARLLCPGQVGECLCSIRPPSAPHGARACSSSTGEFDPGSERTLAACLTHASRTRKGSQDPRYSGERVSNTWVTYPWVRNNLPKGGLIPDDDTGSSDFVPKADLFMKVGAWGGARVPL